MSIYEISVVGSRVQIAALNVIVPICDGWLLYDVALDCLYAEIESRLECVELIIPLSGVKNSKRIYLEIDKELSTLIREHNRIAGRKCQEDEIENPKKV